MGSGSVHNEAGMAMRKQQMQEDGENIAKCKPEAEVGDLGIVLEPEDSRVLELAVADSGSLDEVIMKANLHGIEDRVVRRAFKDPNFWKAAFRKVIIAVRNATPADGMTNHGQAQVRRLSSVCAILEDAVARSTDPASKSGWMNIESLLEAVGQVADFASNVRESNDIGRFLVWCCLAPVLAALRKKAMAGDNACCFDRRVNKISNSQD